MICELIFKCKVTQKYQLIGLYCPQFTIYTHRRNYLARHCGGRLRFLPYSAGFCLQPQPVSDFQRVKLGNIHKISNFSFGFITPEQGAYRGTSPPRHAMAYATNISRRKHKSLFFIVNNGKMQPKVWPFHNKYVLLHSLMERDVAQLVSARVWGA